MTDEDESTDSGIIVAAERAILKFLRVCPDTSGRIAEFSEHEAD